MTLLRDGRTDDLATVLALNNDAVPAVNRLDHRTLGDLVATSERLVIAGQDDPVAFLLLLAGPGLEYDSPNYRWFSRRHRSFLYVDRIVVAADHRGKGLGRLLYEQVIDEGRGRFPVLCAEVNLRPRNATSLAFHAALGFEPVGEQDTEGGQKRVVLLERTL